jgi:hypothetical protein
MNTISLTMRSLVDRTLIDLLAPAELSLQSPLSSAIGAVDTSLTLADASAFNVSDFVEVDDELMLVTGKTADVVPVVTVSRGYYGTVAAAHSAGALVAVNPRHPKVRVAEAIRRSFPRLESLGLPLVQTDTFAREPGNKFILLDDNVRDVHRVAYISTEGRWTELDAWEFIDDAPTLKFGGPKILRTPRYVLDDDDIEITYQIPYRWSTWPNTPDMDATVTMIEGTEDIPSLYAVCWLLARREISRTEIDRSTEWNQGEPSRGGVSSSLIRVMWQDFYRTLDEAKTLIPAQPKHRPYRKMQNWTR